MRTRPGDGRWINLTYAQADGSVCVVCGRDFEDNRITWRYVGRSVANTPVFACEGTCESSASLEQWDRGP